MDPIITPTWSPGSYEQSRGRVRRKPLTINGMEIVISQDQPKMQLSADCPVSDDVRAEINLWMIDYFGMTNTIEDDVTLVMQHLGKVFMNPRTYERVAVVLIPEQDQRRNEWMKENMLW